MVRSDISRKPADRGSRSQSWITWSLSRYDLVLALIPLALAIGIFASVLFEIELPTAMATASVLGLGMILDTVYRNPPGSTGDSTDRGSRRSVRK